VTEQPTPNPTRNRLPVLLAAIGLGTVLIATGVAIRHGGADGRAVAEQATTAAPEPDAPIPTPSAEPSGDTPDPVDTATPTPDGEATQPPTATLPAPTAEETLDEASLPTPVPTRAIPLNTGSYAGPSEPSGTAVPSPAALLPVPDGVTNILLMGNDKRADDPGLRTDTIMIVSINTKEGTVNMLSLPRDLLVYVPGWKMSRINTVYAHGESTGWPGGGFGLMQEMLLYNFGIYVGHYAMIDLSGFQDVVDVLGGIEVPVDCAMQGYVLREPRMRAEDFATYEEWADYTGDESNWEIYTLPVGVHELDGYMALWYARWRKGLDDFDRAYRQQQVLRAIVDRARESGFLNVARIPQLWREYNDLVQTSMGMRNLIDLAPVAADLEGVEIHSYVVTRSVLISWDDPETPNVDYYQLPDTEAMQALAQNYVINNTVTVEVRNGTSAERLDEVAASTLIWHGIDATPTGYADGQTYDQTVIYDYTGREKTSQLQLMQAELRVSDANVIVEPNPSRAFDYVVVLGQNYRTCTRRPDQAPVSGVELTPTADEITAEPAATPAPAEGDGGSEGGS
jgi:LCP family protein required for cell wall assembly